MSVHSLFDDEVLMKKEGDDGMWRESKGKWKWEMVAVLLPQKQAKIKRIWMQMDIQSKAKKCSQRLNDRKKVREREKRLMLLLWLLLCVWKKSLP